MRPSTRTLVAIFLATPILAAAPARHPTYEPIVIPEPAQSRNQLLNAKTTASGQWSDRSSGLAVNGDKKPGDHWACENLPVWHQVDLESPTEISALRVWPYWGDERVYQYKVEGSADGKTWSLLGDMTANSITSTADSGDTWQFGGMLIGISEIQPLKKVMVSVHAPHEIAILRSELVGRTPTSANPVLREAMRGMMKGISSNRPGIH
jgi:hypothetical protein